jgi:aryl-alcohol dehydrogenase-like predicted oxidoreductase
VPSGPMRPDEGVRIDSAHGERHDSPMDATREDALDARLIRPRTGASEAVPVVLGCMNFGRRTPEPEAARIVARALERGVTLFDTANAYGDGESERILGRILRGLPSSDRARAEVATKVGWWRAEGLRPERVTAALDESLGRLSLDSVALYYLHVPDHGTPIEATLEGVSSVIQSGKARHFGLSNYASWQILEVLTRCDRMGLPRPAVSQQLYNLLIRQLDLEYLRFARRYGLHTTVYNPLAGGLLTGRQRSAEPAPGTRFHKNGLYQRRYLSDVFLDASTELARLAADLDLTPVGLAYGFLAARDGVDSILVGPGSVSHLDEALDAVARPLAPEAMSAVDAIHRRLVGTDASYAR